MGREIGLVRQFQAVDRMYGVMRRYYRYPAIDEILLAWPPPSSLNANLRPENGYELEFGMDWSFNSLLLNSRIFDSGWKMKSFMPVVQPKLGKIPPFGF